MYERIELPGTRIQLTLQRRQDGLERLATPITLSLEDLDGLTEDKVHPRAKTASLALRAAQEAPRSRERRLRVPSSLHSAERWAFALTSVWPCA